MHSYPIEVDARTVSAHGMLREKGLEALKRLLLPFQRRITRVRLQFRPGQASGRQGDTACEIQVSLAGRATLFVEHRAGNAWGALLGAARAIRNLLREHMDLSRAHRTASVRGVYG